MSETFRDVYPKTPDQCEDGFRRDEDPESEMDIRSKVLPLQTGRRSQSTFSRPMPRSAAAFMGWH